jgi:diguanylate cyclase (GGDEF)-like protein/PAS domain S-box-containing protein
MIDERIRTILRANYPSDQNTGTVPPIPFKRLWWIAILLLILSVGAVVWTIYLLREDDIRAAISESGSVASVMADQLSRSIQSIDGALLEVKRVAEANGVVATTGSSDRLTQDRFLEYLDRQLASMRQVFSLAVADKDGNIVVSTLTGIGSRFNIADRQYFMDARSRRDGELTLSIPAPNRVTGVKTIVFARQLDDGNGNFSGIVLASVDTKYFEDIYGAIQSVHSLMFSLLNPDGVILFRHPDQGDSTGQYLSNKAEWLKAIARKDQIFRVRGRISGDTRYVSIRRVPQYPLIVDVSLAENTVLATWKTRTATIVSGSSVLLILSLYLLAAIKGQVRRLSMSEASLAEKSQQLDAALNNMSQGLTMYDAQGRLLLSNAEFRKISGLSADDLRRGTSIKEIIQTRMSTGTAPKKTPLLFAESFKHARETGASRTIMPLDDGRTISITRRMMENGGWVSIHQDITEQKRIEAQLERMARYDNLTGLANRAVLKEKISEALNRTLRHDQQFALLMLDLDRFKTVNDSLGHPAGDAILCETANRLKATTREIDCVARLGGDEFAIVLGAEDNLEEAVIALSHRILREIRRPYDIEGRTLTIGTSIGIALAPQDGINAAELIKHADLALYQAKAEGRDRFCFFREQMEKQAKSLRELEDDLRGAVTRGEFELYYQTIFDLKNSRCAGVEALVRWHHPERGLLNPSEFVPLAEESGLIVELGRRIIRQACTDAAGWPPEIRIGVNLSAAQFKQDDLLEVIKATLDETQLPARRLVLEITETLLLDSNPKNLAVLHELKSLGISIVLDDFGVGYSSMKYLLMFPFDGIKIDQSFIKMMDDHSGSAIVSALAGLGRSLNMMTTAEGAETVDQITFLRAAGCQYAQGYLLGVPTPASSLTFDLPDTLRRSLVAA